MMETEPAKKTVPPHFDAAEARMRSLTLNVSLAIGILSTSYFGITDALRHHVFLALVSLSVVVVFGMILSLNIFFHRFQALIISGFVVVVGIAFFILLATQFPHPTISLWCLPFPILALFLLGQRQGIVAVAVFNLGVICIFLLDIYLQTGKYTGDFAIRYCGVLLVISVISYYFEASRARSHARMNALNQSLERRVEERTKALEESQERLRQAEKLESIGLLAGGIAHDFNNQLAGIMAFADLIRMTAKDNAEIRECAESILASGRRSADLIKQLLAFARKGTLLAVPVDIHHTVADIISLLKHTIDKRIILRTQLVTDPSIIRADPAQLHNALLNIAINARDAMPEGGELTFTTDIADCDEAYCGTLHGEIRPGTYLRLCIADTGCGMDKKVLNRIFEPFFTTKERGKGTGMGLPAVYGTMRSHDGAIAVSSEPGKGTSFSLYFPLLKATAAIPYPEAETGPVEKQHGHVCLVDDEQAVLESCGKLLQLMGFTFISFSNGRDALEYYRNNWKSVDLVILDLVMPVMDGKGTFIAMKKINPDIVALLISGYSLNGEAQSVLDMGARGFIQKPFTLSEICQKTLALLGRME